MVGVSFLNDCIILDNLLDFEQSMSESFNNPVPFLFSCLLLVLGYLFFFFLLEFCIDN